MGQVAGIFRRGRRTRSQEPGGRDLRQGSPAGISGRRTRGQGAGIPDHGPGARISSIRLRLRGGGVRGHI